MTIYPRTSDDLIKRLRDPSTSSEASTEAADYIEQLDRDWINLKNVALDNVGELLETQAKLANAVRIGNKMAASIKGNYYIPNVVAEWVAVLAELEGEGMTCPPCNHNCNEGRNCPNGRKK
jgi:hypothetical protein